MAFPSGKTSSSPILWGNDGGVVTFTPEIYTMSMIGCLARISEEVQVALHDQPELITGLLYPDFEAPSKTPKVSIFARWFGKGNETPAQVEVPPKATLVPLVEEDQMDIDKAWHVLHFLFTGAAWEADFPEGFLATCGTPVGDVDVGYGPARSFSPKEVKQIASFLTGLREGELRGRMDFKKMTELEIYCGGGEEGEITDGEWSYWRETLTALTKFVVEAANRNMAVLVYIA
ncbi:MAG TPA: YfbM family protein [Verrucomicrobium sp.]|nr:YfbM family protein [Verrucomicrobium sp.]